MDCWFSGSQRQPTRFSHTDGHARAAVGVQNEAGVVARRVIAAVDSDAGRVDREWQPTQLVAVLVDDHYVGWAR